MVDKYIKEGKVAILYSPGFGAGWSTWGKPEMAWDKELVEAFINGGHEFMIKVSERKYPDEYTGGGRYVKIYWMEQGTAFRINEYDGSESVEIIGEQSFYVA